MFASHKTDPFSRDRINAIPPLVLQPPSNWDGFHLDQTLENEYFPLQEPTLGPLPDIEPQSFALDFQNVPLPTLSNPSSLIADADLERGEKSGETDDFDGAAGVWRLRNVEATSSCRLISWDRFDDPNPLRASRHIDAVAPCAGTSFGAPTVRALRADHGDKRATDPLILDIHTYNSKLLGRFQDNFVQLRSTASTWDGTLENGALASQRLGATQGALLMASRSALFAALQFMETLRPKIDTLAQLKTVTTKIESMMTTLQKWADTIHGCEDDLTTVSQLLRMTSTEPVAHSGLENVLQEIFTQLCNPILTRLTTEVGLADYSVEERTAVHWTVIFPTNLSDLTLETKQGLERLRTFSPACPLLAARAVQLDLAFTSDGLLALQTRADDYEDAMMASLIPVNMDKSASPARGRGHAHRGGYIDPVAETTAHSLFRLDADLFTKGVSVFHDRISDRLSHQVTRYLESTELAVTSSRLNLRDALIMSVSPMIAAQHRLLRISTLQLLFQHENMLAHVNLLHDFVLFGDASFAARLRRAWFDSEDPWGDASSAGSHVPLQTTWHPASSTLRLTLMGVLSDSLATHKYRDLTDTLSFAVRDLPTEDGENGRRVHPIHAPDFLRMHYKPPRTLLETVVTAPILDKYDRISQYLLRVMRLQSVTQGLVRCVVHRHRQTPRLTSDHKLMVAVHNFVTGLADYCHNVAVEPHWRRFEEALQQAKIHLDRGNHDRVLRILYDHSSLRHSHDETMDKIIHALFLDQGHVVFLRRLEEVLELILSFAQAQGPQCEDDNLNVDATGRSRNEENNETTTGQMQRHCRRTIKDFVEDLESRAQSSGASTSRQRPAGASWDDSDREDDDGCVNSFDGLLLKVNASGYWTMREGETSTSPSIPP